jgi:hypothetical protein
VHRRYAFTAAGPEIRKLRLNVAVRSTIDAPLGILQKFREGSLPPPEASEFWGRISVERSRLAIFIVNCRRLYCRSLVGDSDASRLPVLASL